MVPCGKMKRLSYPLGVLVVLVLMHGLTMPPVAAQMPWPLQGVGIPPDGRTVVTVDVLVDSIEAINSDRNSWTGHVWFHLRWDDARAPAIMANATQAWLDQGGLKGGCGSPCDSSGHVSGGCCDGVFLPHIEIPNLVDLSQGAVYSTRVWLKADGIKTMHWSARFSADFHSPFDFRAWPFEHQHLLIEMQVPAALGDRLALVIGEASHLQNTPHTKGEVITGWRLVSTTKRSYDPSGCWNLTDTRTSIYNISNGTAAFKALKPDGWAQTSQADAPGSVPSIVNIQDCQIMGNGTAESLSLYGPRYVLVDTMVQRERNYYVLANIVPMILLAYMVFVTYAMERSDLEARMGVVVTLVLAISALQFTWSFPPASYLNTVQQITLMSYVLYFIVAIESMITAHICRLHARKRDIQQLQAVVASPGLSNAGSMNDRSTPFANSASSVVADMKLNQKLAMDRNQFNTSLTVAKPPAVAVDVIPSPRQPNSNTSSFGRDDSVSGEVDGTAKRLPPGAVAEGCLSDSKEESAKSLTKEGGDSARANQGVIGGQGLTPVISGRPSLGTLPESPGRPSATTPKGKKWYPVTTSLMAGFGKSSTSMNNFGRAMSMRVSAITKGTNAMKDRITKDEAFAQLFASRMDTICCWFLFVAYTITVSVLLYVNSQVGDHKLQLVGATAPANM